jgi:hypothetical protein
MQTSKSKSGGEYFHGSAQGGIGCPVFAGGRDSMSMVTRCQHGALLNYRDGYSAYENLHRRPVREVGSTRREEAQASHAHDRAG